MALKIYERYQPLANPGNASYPTGSIKNRTAKEIKDGTPIEQDWANDLLGMRDAILAAGDVDADGVPESATASQVVEALKKFLLDREDVGIDDPIKVPTTGDADGRYARLSGGSDADFSSMPMVDGAEIVSSGSTNAG